MLCSHYTLFPAPVPVSRSAANTATYGIGVINREQSHYDNGRLVNGRHDNTI